MLFGLYQCYNSSNSCHHMKKSCVISDDRNHPIASLSKTTNAFYGRDLQMTHCLEMLGNCGSLIYLFLLNSLHKVLLVMFPKWTNYNAETKDIYSPIKSFFKNLKSVLQSECLNKNVIISLPLSFSLPLSLSLSYLWSMKFIKPLKYMGIHMEYIVLTS